MAILSSYYTQLCSFKLEVFYFSLDRKTHFLGSLNFGTEGIGRLPDHSESSIKHCLLVPLTTADFLQRSLFLELSLQGRWVPEDF